MRQKNPFHIYPIYDADTDLSLRGFYYTPTYKTMHFQFYRSGSATVSAFDLLTTNGEILGQDTGQISTATTDGGVTFYWTTGSTLVNPPIAGQMYRPRITLSNGLIYYGHLCCPSAVFDISYPELGRYACVSDLFNIEVQFPAGAGIAVKLFDNNQTTAADATTYANPPNFTLDPADYEVDGSNDGNLTMTINYTIIDPNGGTREVARSWSITWNTSDICGTFTVTQLSESDVVHTDAFELTSYNSDDIQSEGIYYGGGFRQKFWFKGYFATPEPRTTENYLQNGNGAQFFQSARVSDAERLEFWPCPDAAHKGLVKCKYNDSNVITGGAETATLYRLEFEVIEIDTESVNGGRIIAEFDGAFVQREMTDYVIP